MVRWWTKPPIIIAALGVLAVIITALLSRTTITQYRPVCSNGAENWEDSIED